MNEQFFLGVHGHAGEVGADGGPFAGEQVALGALGHVHFLAAGHVAGLLQERHHLGNHALAIRVGKPAAEREQLDGPLGHGLVRVGGECRLLIEGEHVEAERALLDGVEERLHRFGFGEHEPQRGGTHGRRQVFELCCDRGPERLGFRLVEGFEDPGRDGRRRLRRDRGEQCRHGFVVVRFELDDLFGGLDAVRFGSLRIGDGGERGLGQFRELGIEALHAPDGGELDEFGTRKGRELGKKRNDDRLIAIE